MDRNKEMKYLLPTKLRSAVLEDYPWILNTWATSATNDTMRRYEIDNKNPNEYKHLKINSSNLWAQNICLAEKLLKTQKCLVACDPNNINQCYGYVVYNDNVLHWIYTKLDFRNVGVADSLIAEAFSNTSPLIIYTITYSIRHYKDKWNLVYDSNKLKEIIKITGD